MFVQKVTKLKCTEKVLKKWLIDAQDNRKLQVFGEGTFQIRGLVLHQILLLLH